MATGTGVEEKRCDLSDIDESLQQILHSKEFRDALQLQALLKFIVEKSIGGSDDALKERIIGISVFGRKPDYETADDPIVRSRVRQLRKRLERYYKSEEAKDSAIEIVIPKGSYKPSFVFRSAIGNTREKVHPSEQGIEAQGPYIGPVEEDLKSPNVALFPPLAKPARRQRPREAFLIGALLLPILALIGVAKWPRSNLDLLWGPVFDSKRSVIIYTGSYQMYLPSTMYSYSHLSSQAGDLDQPFVPDVGNPSQTTTAGPALAATDMVITPYRCVRPEAIETNLRVAALLNAHHLSVESRVEPNLPFVDLHGSPIVLVGAYSNYWTAVLTQDLPYFFDRGGRIHERGGRRRVWSTPPGKDDRISQDYAIVARLLNSKAGGPVIIVAGITTCGTEAAAEFVTDSVQLRRLDILPKAALREKNLEIVLRTSLINCNSTSLDVVGQRYW